MRRFFRRDGILAVRLDSNRTHKRASLQAWSCLNLGMARHAPTMMLLLFVLLLAACQGGGLEGEVEPTSTPIPTAPAIARPTFIVQRGDVREILEFTGRWQPRDQMSLSFEIGGTIRRVNVQRGDTVSAGQLLADYQITDLEDQLASAQLSLETALASLESGTEGSVQTVADAEVQLANARLTLESRRASSPWTSVASARIDVQSAEQAVANAQRSYDEAISRPEQDADVVDNAYEQLQNARQNLRSRQISYDSAAQNFNNQEFDVAQAENAVIQAELALERARAGGGNPDGEQSVRSAQLQIDQINADIARSSLYAPIDGEVLEVNIIPGDAVQAFEVVITIGRPEPKEALASLAIADAQRLSVGMVGECNILNDPNSLVQCIVRRLPLSSQDADQTTRVAATLPNAALGQLIEVDMPLQVREGVLWLPPEAIRTFQDRTFVVLETPEGQRVADVELGLQTDERVEIISGVNEGDIVVGP